VPFKIYLLAGLASLLLSFVSGLFVIPLLKRIKCGQPILKYVETHKDKSGTPTMGGLFFVLSAAVVYIAFGGYAGKLGIVSLSIGLSYMLVGFLDDFIKIKTHKNEGLKPYQKIVFQGLIAIFAGVFSYYNGITEFFIPFTVGSVNLGFWAIPFIAFIFLAITNSVNLTDGLDGLAAGSFLISLAVMLILIPVNEFNSEILTELFFMTSGFLFFNLRPAKTFMGDTGSHFLGGALASLCVMNGNTLAIIPAGFIFIIEMLSSAVQIFTIRKLNKKVFLMAPLHHHFQKKGFDETAVTLRFWLVHAVGALIISLLFA